MQSMFLNAQDISKPVSVLDNEEVLVFYNDELPFLSTGQNKDSEKVQQLEKSLAGVEITDKGTEIILRLIFKEGNLSSTKKEDLLNALRNGFLKRKECGILLKKQNKGFMGQIYVFNGNGYTLIGSIVENKKRSLEVLGFSVDQTDW